MTQTDSDKQRLREHFRKVCAQLSEATKTRKSQSIVDQVLELEVYRHAQTILCYLNLPTEVATGGLIEQALAAGKRVYAPVISGAELRAGAITQQTIFSQNKFGVREPHVKPLLPSALALELIIVPGLAFSREGVRLGRGLGYYDRLLSTLPHVPTLGLAFTEQIARSLPRATHDVVVDRIVIS